MAKAQSVVTSTEYDSTTNTVTVTVKHTGYASYSRSVQPAAFKAFKANAAMLGFKFTGGRYVDSRFRFCEPDGDLCVSQILYTAS